MKEETWKSTESWSLEFYEIIKVAFVIFNFMISELEEVIKEVLTALKEIVCDWLLCVEQDLRNVILTDMKENLCNHQEEVLQNWQVWKH